jgi:hypothetical protein
MQEAKRCSLDQVHQLHCLIELKEQSYHNIRRLSTKSAERSFRDTSLCLGMQVQQSCHTMDSILLLDMASKLIVQVDLDTSLVDKAQVDSWMSLSTCDRLGIESFVTPGLSELQASKDNNNPSRKLCTKTTNPHLNRFQARIRLFQYCLMGNKFPSCKTEGRLQRQKMIVCLCLLDSSNLLGICDSKQLRWSAR